MSIIHVNVTFHTGTGRSEGSHAAAGTYIYAMGLQLAVYSQLQLAQSQLVAKQVVLQLNPAQGLAVAAAVDVCGCNKGKLGAADSIRAPAAGEQSVKLTGALIPSAAASLPVLQPQTSTAAPIRLTAHQQQLLHEATWVYTSF